MKKRGNKLGFWFFETVLKKGGLRPAYAFLYPVCLYYLFFDPSARRGAVAYVARQFPAPGRKQRCRLSLIPIFRKIRQLERVYLLFVSQGKNLIDRYVYAANPSVFHLEECGFEKLDALRADSKQGFVLLTAHTGNWQIAMTVLDRFDRTVHLLMRPEDNSAVQESLQIQNENGKIKIISVDGPMGGLVEAMQALEKGDVVSIMGDRAYGARSVPVDFIGAPAQFPCAAYLMAASAQCPVVTLLSSKADTYKYEVEISDCFTPKWERGKSKNSQLQAWTQRFATILDRYLKTRPFQCFLFHNIWESTS